jgi:hypothetical protein
VLDQAVLFQHPESFKAVFADFVFAVPGGLAAAADLDKAADRPGTHFVFQAGDTVAGYVHSAVVQPDVA